MWRLLRTNYINSIYNKINNYIKTKYEPISKDNMKLGDGIFNRRCQLNAVQKVKEHKCDEVVLCAVIDEYNEPVVHFINSQNISNPIFIDNTLGWQYENCEYYIIKTIEKDEYDKIDDILYDAKKALFNLYSKSILNFIFNVTFKIL